MLTDKENNVSEFPESVNAFQENWTKKHPGKMPGYCHNVYQILIEDLDGNVVDEKFAVNCMTDYGFSQIFTTVKSQSILYLWAGNGEGEIDPASQQMISILPGRSATNTYDSVEFMGQRFYPEIGMTVCRFHIHSAYFDYTHWDEDKTITEIGLGNSSNNLYYHAKIYDEDGNETTLTKKVYQRLTINVYAKMLVPIADMCNKAWNKKCFLLVQAYCLYKYNQYSDYLNELNVIWDSYYVKDYDWWNGEWKTQGDGGTIDDAHVYNRKINNIGGLLIEGWSDYVSDIVYSDEDKYYNRRSWFRHNGYFLALFKPKLETPIPIETNWFQTDIYHSDTFEMVFGKYPDNYYNSRYGMLPVTDIEFSSLKMYSCQDHDYTIDVDHVNPTIQAQYDIALLRYSIKDYNYIEHLGKEAWFRVWVNDATDVPITKFNISGYTFYATDTYWDSSTWEIIPNVANIPENLRNKRYYCSLSTAFDGNNTAIDSNYGDRYYTISVTRDQEYHKIIPKTPKRYCSFGVYTQDYYDPKYHDGYGSSLRIAKCISNDELGYIATLDTIIFPESSDPNPTLGWDPEHSSSAPLSTYPYKYELFGYNGSTASLYSMYNTTRGRHIVTFGFNSENMKTGCRVYTITNASTQPTYQDFTFDQVYSKFPHFSHSDNGYLVLSYISGENNLNKTHVVRYDVEGDNEPTMFSVTGYNHAHAIDLTDYFCGINSEVTDHLSLDIYDMKNQEVVDTIDIPEGYTFAGMAGWKNFIYIRVLMSGSYSTYVYYIQEKILTSTPLNLPHMLIDTNSYAHHIQRAVESNGVCESCMVLLGYDNEQRFMLFKESDPLNPIPILQYPSSSYTNGSRLNRECIFQNAQLRYVNNNKQLLLAVTTYYRCVVFDIGWILDNGSLPVCRENHFYYHDGRNKGCSNVLYKNSVGLMCMYDYIGRYNNTDYCYRQYYWLEPYEGYMNFQLKATTKTINSYHNPVRIGPVGGFDWSITNRNVVPTQSTDETTTK